MIEVLNCLFFLLKLEEDKVAEKIGITKYELRKYLNGTNNITLNFLYKLEPVLGISITNLNIIAGATKNNINNRLAIAEYIVNYYKKKETETENFILPIIEEESPRKAR